MAVYSSAVAALAAAGDSQRLFPSVLVVPANLAGASPMWWHITADDTVDSIKQSYVDATWFNGSVRLTRKSLWLQMRRQNDDSDAGQLKHYVRLQDVRLEGHYMLLHCTDPTHADAAADSHTASTTASKR